MPLVRSQFSTVEVTTSPSPPTPTEATAMSRLPNSSTVFATAASTLPALETSPWTNFAPISSATSCDLGVEIEDHDPCTFRDEGLGGGKAEPRSAAGHECDLVLELHEPVQSVRVCRHGRAGVPALQFESQQRITNRVERYTGAYTTSITKNTPCFRNFLTVPKCLANDRYRTLRIFRLLYLICHPRSYEPSRV